MALSAEMRRRYYFALALVSCCGACSPERASTQCKGLSPSKATGLAVERKNEMLDRSAKSYRANFASDASTLATDLNGYVAKVYFRGRDGRTLIAIIDEDCYVGWTQR